MAYTHKNLKEVEGLGAGLRLRGAPGGALRHARTWRPRTPASPTTWCAPSQRQGFGHQHENAEEIYVVLSGSGRAKLDDEILDVDDDGRDPRGAGGRRARSRPAPEGLELLAFGPRHEGDGELVQDFWPAG